MEQMNMARPTGADAPLSGLAQLSVLVQPFGIVLPILLSLIIAGRSRFLARHTAQAVVWQAFFLLLYLALGIIAAIALLVVALSGLWHNLVEHMPLRSVPPTFLAVLYVLIGIGLVMSIVEWVVGVVAAATAFQGRPYRYPLVGALADRMFNTTPNN